MIYLYSGDYLNLKSEFLGSRLWLALNVTVVFFICKTKLGNVCFTHHCRDGMRKALESSSIRANTLYK
jgi:hypothetical protein